MFALLATVAVVGAGQAANTNGVGRRSKTIKLRPTDCIATSGTERDCYATFASAIGSCRDHASLPGQKDGSCTITLAAGDYRVTCPSSKHPRPTSAQIAWPAISLDRVHSVTFGGEDGVSQPSRCYWYKMIPHRGLCCCARAAACLRVGDVRGARFVDKQL
jgi:hypothetical protein